MLSTSSPLVVLILQQVTMFSACPMISTGILMSSNASGKKKRLQELFHDWCGEVTELISETPEDVILRRDIFDRDMIHTWGIGRVTLLGDAAHPMQPNLGQGGCMAIEVYMIIHESTSFLEKSIS